MKTVLTLILVQFLIVVVYSQGPPITTETPVMLGLEGSGIRTFGKFISKEQTHIYLQAMGIPFNLSPKFQIGASVPFKIISPDDKQSRDGFSDMSIFAKYQLFKKDGTAKTFRILAHLKQSFPTGKTTTDPPISPGIYQTYLGFIIGKISTRTGIYGDFGYNITSHHVTDNITFNFSLGVPLLPQKYPQKQINTFLEFNGNYLIGPKIKTLFVSPGLQFIPGRRILFETSFQIPLLQENISTNKTKYMLLLGMRFLLN